MIACRLSAASKAAGLEATCTNKQLLLMCLQGGRRQLLLAPGKCSFCQLLMPHKPAAPRSHPAQAKAAHVLHQLPAAVCLWCWCTSIVAGTAELCCSSRPFCCTYLDEVIDQRCNESVVGLLLRCCFAQHTVNYISTSLSTTQHWHGAPSRAPAA